MVPRFWNGYAQPISAGGYKTSKFGTRRTLVVFRAKSMDLNIVPVEGTLHAALEHDFAILRLVLPHEIWPRLASYSRKN